jgi:hypothetical protein
MRGYIGKWRWLAAVIPMGCGSASDERSPDEQQSGVSGAAQILEAMRVTYATASTYRDEVDTVSQFITDAGDTSESFASSETVFRRPNGFRFVFAAQKDFGRDPHPADLGAPDYIILQNDRHIVSRFYLNDAAEDASSLEEATGAAAGVTEGISMLIEPLLSGASHGLLTDVRHASTTDDLVVDGVECFVLTTELPPALGGLTRGTELRLAIGKDDYLLRQIEERVFFIGDDAVGEDAVAHEGALRTLKAKLHAEGALLELLENSRNSYTSETTFTLHPQANIEIPTREFDDDRLQIRPNPPARITTYEGIGAALIAAKPGGWLIKRVYPGTPAERANLRSSDRILAVDGIDVTDDGEDVVVARIKGPAGTPVSLKVERGDDVLRVDLRRERFTLTD